jgi:RNA polymerase sigma factor (TIGR02999 family)
MSNVTQILSRIDSGDQEASAQLFPLVYDELRKLAAAQLAREKPGQTLQSTALVHEAYMRLVGGSQQWSGRNHFFGAAAEAMRRILVDVARRKATAKHGGQQVRHSLDDCRAATAAPPDEVLAVHEALDRLASEDRVAAELVKLHYFGGFSLEEAAELVGISRARAYRTWTYARTWLRTALLDEADAS